MPETPQTRWPALAMIWFGGMISVPSLVIGSTLVAGLPFFEALLAGFVGFCVVTLYMSLESVAAVEQRLDTVSLATSSFGTRGARLLVGAALGVSLIGWFGVQSDIAGASIARIAALTWNVTLGAPVLSFAIGMVMMLTAVMGFQHLKWLNVLAVPCKIALVVYAVVLTFQAHSFDLITQYQPPEAQRLDLLTAIGLSIGFFSVGGVIGPDYAQHAATRRDAILGCVLGLLPAALGLAACGAMLAIVQRTYNVVEIYSRLDRPVLALSVLVLATWTTNVMNAYSSGLAINQLLHWPARRRGVATVLAGCAGSLLAAAGALSHFQSFLMFLAITIPPIAGVLVSDYWLARSYRRNEAAAYDLRGILAWAAGVISMLAVTHPLRNVLGIVVAAAAHLVFVRVNAPAVRSAAE
jgi:cytosine permease